MSFNTPIASGCNCATAKTHQRLTLRLTLSFSLLLAATLASTAHSGEVVGWGSDEHGQVTVPDGVTDVVAVAAGAAHSLALRNDGTVVIWGQIYNGLSYDKATLPEGLSDVVAISVGFFHSLALKSDGTVLGWGYDEYGAASGGSELSNIVAISANADQSLALKADGTVVAWGRGTAASTQVPSWLNNVKAISAGQVHNLALRNDGTIVGWGANNYGQATGSPTEITSESPHGSATGIVTIRDEVLKDVIAIAGGGNHSLALRRDGTVVAWGRVFDESGVVDAGVIVPEGLSGVVAISAGFDHDLALKDDGSVVAWGNGKHGETAVPAGLTIAAAIAAGDKHSLAVRQGRFRRGDSDANGIVNITDAVSILNFLFLGIGSIPCDDAADSDDNGSVNITDAVSILNVLFLGIGAIPAPGRDACGLDPTDDALGCTGALADC